SQPLAIERADEIERLALEAGINAGGAGHVENRIALVPQPNTRIDAGQKAAGPVGGPAADAGAGGHDDEARQVPGFGPETVRRPRANAGPARLRGARVQEDLGGGVVELVSMDGP